MNVHPSSTAGVAIGARAQEPGRRILGVDVVPLDQERAIRLLGRRIADRQFTKVGFLNAHIANIASKTPEFSRILEDFLVFSDGIGVDLASRILYRAPFPANLNGTDFLPAFLKSQKGPLTVGLLGATRKNAEEAVNRLQRLVPQHHVVLIHDGYFDPTQEEEILSRLKRERPDVLLVAMGVPRQECWIASRLTDEHCTMAFAVGALLDFLSGAIPRAPGWVRRLRMEWLFRLILEPGRLWRRYIVGNPMFLFRVLRQRLQMTVPRA